MDLEKRSGNEDGNRISGTHPEVFDGNGNKHSETLLEVTDANRSSMLSEEVADKNGSSSYFELQPRLAGRSESINHFQINPEIYPEVVGWSQSTKKSDPHLELTGSNDNCQGSRIEPHASISEGHEPIPAKKLRSSSSASSSSVSSIDDLFHVSVNDINNSTSPKANEDIRPTPMVDENEGCSDYNPKSEVLDNVSPGLTSTSQTSGITSEQLANGMLPTTQSPPIQTMDRLEGYDPLRIPSSIFSSSKPSTPMEWSVASNESLFSLHIGNSSFRDQALMYGDLTKSGELTKSAELFMLSPPPAIAVAEADGQFSAPVPENDAQNVGKNDEPVKDATKPDGEDKWDQKAQVPIVSWNSTNSNHSYESGISRNSFTFPVLADGVRSTSVTTDDERPHHQPSDSEVAPKQASCGWFPCLSYSYPCSCSWPKCFRTSC